MTKTVFRPITRIGPYGRALLRGRLLREESFTLFCDGRKEAELNCLPFDLEALAVGHLFSLGLLTRREEIHSLDVDRVGRRILLVRQRADRLRTTLDLEISLSPEAVHHLQADFNGASSLAQETDAAHGCALADENGLLVFLEDLDRHNALDKVLGEMILKAYAPAGKVLFFSGRLDRRMVEKAIRGGVKLLIAPRSPSLAAVEAAEAEDVTLLGAVRPGNINIYTHPRRIMGA